MKATRGPTIVTEATGCMEVVASIYPYTSWAVPWLHTAFETAAANASGIDAALKVMRKKGKVKEEHVDIIAIAGDGGTYDIGLQALSGAVERGHDFLFVLYDNEGYMNTGIQRSGGTPTGAATTTTTPAGKVIPGKLGKKKPITEIMIAHDMPYVATATPTTGKTCTTKVRKGLEVEGPAFLHVFAPCPRGWRTEPGKTMEYAKLAVESCVFPLWEVVNGKRQLSTPSKLIELAPQKKGQSPSTSKDKAGPTPLHASEPACHRRNAAHGRQRLGAAHPKMRASLAPTTSFDVFSFLHFFKLLPVFYGVDAQVGFIKILG